MISGRVNSDIEAVIELDLTGPNGDEEAIEAVIDTGFSGDLTLPPSVINSLQLEWIGRETAQLADGSTELFDVYTAGVKWDGAIREVVLQAADAQPLIGMNLLYGYSLRIDVLNNGTVGISSLVSH